MSCSHYEERVEKVELPQLKVNGVAIGETCWPASCNTTRRTATRWRWRPPAVR